MLDVVLNFISLHPDVPGILRLYGQSLSRLTGISVASTRIPRGTPGCPGLHINATAKITVNYLQAEIPVHRDVPVHRDHINRPLVRHIALLKETVKATLLRAGWLAGCIPPW